MVKDPLNEHGIRDFNPFALSSDSGSDIFSAAQNINNSTLCQMTNYSVNSLYERLNNKGLMK